MAKGKKTIRQDFAFFQALWFRMLVDAKKPMILMGRTALMR